MVRERYPGLFNDLSSALFDFYSPEAVERRRIARREQEEDDPYRGGAAPAAPAGYTTAETGGLQRTEKIGRNDPCPCGSGKKYKKCCGQ
jgi:preprotein translocase subunit SecA